MVINMIIFPKKYAYIISFSGITFNDVLVRYGLLEDTPRPPFIPGFECSGEVLDIGTNVTHIEVSLTSSSTMKILFFSLYYSEEIAFLY